jgi:exopolysaccharide production protein ExoY
MTADRTPLGYETIAARALRPLDYALIMLGYTSATAIAAFLNSRHLFIYPAPEEWSRMPLTLIPITLIAWSFVSSYSNIYAWNHDENFSSSTLNLFKTIGLWALISLGALYLGKLKYSSRQFTLEFIFCASLLILIRQLVTTVVLGRHYRAGSNTRIALVVGDEATCNRFITQATPLLPKRYNFVLQSKTSSGRLEDPKRERARLSDADEVFIVGASLRLESEDNPTAKFLRQGKSVHIVPSVIDATFFRKTLGEIGGMPVLSMSCGRLTWLEELLKRVLDVSGSLILLVLTAPVWAVAAALVKLTSPGPILFRQKRLGKAGKPFTLLKFRTMQLDAEHVLMQSSELYERYLANNYKLPPDEDPRITSIGRLMRTFSIDELPQLINVLKGEMSLVGPRPVVPREIGKYGEFAPLFLSVKPGMTGHWQVSGRSEIQEYRERVELDLQYVRDQSIATDVDILVRTIPSVLRRKGAY